MTTCEQKKPPSHRNASYTDDDIKQCLDQNEDIWQTPRGDTRIDPYPAKRPEGRETKPEPSVRAEQFESKTTSLSHTHTYTHDEYHCMDI